MGLPRPTGKIRENYGCLENLFPYDDEILSDAVLKSLPYYQLLVEIRKFFEINDNKNDFPFDRCARAARVVAHTVGLRMAYGAFTPFLLNGDRAYFNHWWNYDVRRGLYVDITQDQFLDLHPIVILGDSSYVLTRERIIRKFSDKRLGEIVLLAKQRFPKAIPFP